MSASSALGLASAPDKQQLEIEYGGVWYPFPIVPGAELYLQPQTPFSPAVQKGNSQQVVDRRLNVRVWDDFTGGIGELRTDPNRGLTNYNIGTLDTRQAGAVALPPKLTSLGNIGGSLTPPVHIESMPAHSGLFAWSEFFGENYYKIGAGAWTQAVAAVKTRAFARFNGAYFVSQESAGPNYTLRTSTNGSVWAAVAGTAGYVGLAVHDNALFTFDTATRKLMKSTDGVTFSAASAAIGAAGSGVVAFEPGEGFRQILVWDVPAGNQQTIYLLTTRRLLVLEEEPGYWHDFYQDYPFDGTYAWAHPWRRTNYLYLTFYSTTDPNAVVLVHNGNTTDEVGPRSKRGLPDTYLHGVGFVVGNVHNLYGLGIGGTYGGVYSPGNIIALNDLGGWHPVMAGEKITNNSTTGVVGLGYYNQTVYAAVSNGDIYSVTDPDRVVTHPRSGTNVYDSNIHYLRSAYDDDGLTNVWKIGAYFLVDTRLADGSPGIPTNSVLTLRYRVDGGGWTTFLSLVGGSGFPASWPAKLVMPSGAAQTGAAYLRLQWEVQMQNNAGGASPVLAALSLYYSLWLEQFYSLQAQVDFTDKRWREFPNQRLNGYEREDLQRTLDTISRNKGYVQVRWGRGAARKTIVATDMLLSHRAVPNLGGSVTTVTIRDLTAPNY